MALSLKDTRAISGIVDVLYDFLPGSGNAAWRGHVNFGTVATKVGVTSFWPGGSKKPAINALLSQTLEQRRSLFQSLVVERKPTWLDDVHRHPKTGAETHYCPRILRDIRLIQGEAHRFSEGSGRSEKCGPGHAVHPRFF